MTPTNSTEVSNIISSLNLERSDDISSQLAVLFNQPFSSGKFSSILKTIKIIPIYKKDSKLESSNYRLISLLSNIGKILERPIYNTLCNFLETKEVIFSLRFGCRQKYLTTHTLTYLTDKIRQEISVLVKSL